MLIKMSSRKLNVRGRTVSSHQSYAFCMGRNISLMTGLDRMEKNRKKRHKSPGKANTMAGL